MTRSLSNRVTVRRLPSVCPSSVNNCLLLWNRLSDSFEIWYADHLGWPQLDLFKSWWNLHICIFGAFYRYAVFGQKLFFSETAYPITLKFDMHVPWGDLSQICSNCGEICIFVFLGHFLLFLVKKSSSLKPLVQSLWNLICRSLGVILVRFV